MEKTKRLVNADVIRVLAMMMVVVFHTISSFTVREDFLFTKLYFLFEPIVVISRVAVLLFFILSGYLVLGKQRSFSDNLKKTLKKIILPLSFFTLINVFLEWIHFSQTSTTISTFIGSQITRMSRMISSPMWFLVVLSFLYLLNPIWSKLFKNNEKQKLAKSVTGLFLLFSVMITIFDHFFLLSGNIFSSLNYWLGFIFFYLYGALLKKRWIKYDNQIINIGIFLIGFVSSLAGNLAYTYLKNNSSSIIGLDYFESYLSIPVILMTIGIFNFLLSINLEKLRSNLLLWLSSLSFGVYLIHTYILRLFIDYIGFTIDNLKINVYLFNVINLVLVFTISIIITYLLKKIPKVKALIGG